MLRDGLRTSSGSVGKERNILLHSPIPISKEDNVGSRMSQTTFKKPSRSKQHPILFESRGEQETAERERERDRDRDRDRERERAERFTMNANVNVDKMSRLRSSSDKILPQVDNRIRLRSRSSENLQSMKGADMVRPRDSEEQYYEEEEQEASDETKDEEELDLRRLIKDLKMQLRSRDLTVHEMRREITKQRTTINNLREELECVEMETRQEIMESAKQKNEEISKLKDDLELMRRHTVMMMENLEREVMEKLMSAVREKEEAKAEVRRMRREMETIAVMYESRALGHSRHKKKGTESSKHHK
eukprot:TRINITY_DN2372_c0_g2_i1.p1 TRINITY_DN2372_c0_g2~~TRINITY_DN2372_c0_g2_i1.p1  ORF type:complete len:304 (-),score=73.59 TRINITY_DN2372_c0_g2_i1:54-965(-)